ncbi:MAG: nitrile hydratase subunit beta [Gammaproteobacteria bacterium]|nr:nitrile hydratase subunit beta [Gammaproteobacteria bacterium]
MNGIHDMGGMHGLGPLEIEPDEPWFHHEWERRALALTLATGFLGEWNIDMGRHARERMPGPDYLAATYYEKWMWGLERLLVERGLVPQAEIDARLRDASAPVMRTGHARLLTAGNVANALKKGGSARANANVPARFVPGDPVVARNINPTGHTRLPRYARGRAGVIDRDHGVFVFADTHAMGQGPQPQHLYSVRFAARELWGADAAERDAVYVDLWDSHLDAA